MRNQFTLFFSFLFCFHSFAQNVPEKPSPARFVNDYAGLLSESEAATLEQKLRNYQDTTSNQIAIVTVSSLDNYDIEGYSIALAKKWDIGQKGKNNGILVLVAPNERKMRIEVGYGLEGALPDGTCNKIIREVMKPYFKQNDFYGGLDEATTYIIKYASGEFKADPNDGKGKGGGGWVLAIIVVIIILIFISKFQRARNSHIGGALDFWTILSLMSMTNHNNRGGGSSWGGGSSSDSGSSWDFGGGDFGGGGSSGDW